MQSSDIDHLIERGNRVEMTKAEGRGLLCQVNFKSGNRMTGIMETQPRSGTGYTYRLLAQAQRQDNAGQKGEAIAEHHFNGDDVECIVLLYPAEKPSGIITRS